MLRAKRRLGCAQYAVGCIGVLLGIVVTIGGEIYLGVLAANKVSAVMKEREENGPSLFAYQSMCGNTKALEKDFVLRRLCKEQLIEIQAAAKRKAEKEAADP